MQSIFSILWLLALHVTASAPLCWNKSFPQNFAFKVEFKDENFITMEDTNHHKGEKTDALQTVWLEIFTTKEQFSSQILALQEQWELFWNIWEKNLLAEYTRDGWLLQKMFYPCSE